MFLSFPSLDPSNRHAYGKTILHDSAALRPTRENPRIWLFGLSIVLVLMFNPKRNT